MTIRKNRGDLFESVSEPTSGTRPIQTNAKAARILVVDDSPTVHHFVHMALREDGHILDRLAAFTELPLHVRRFPPDLVILDLEMPALSGAAFGRFFRGVSKVWTPIIIHSSRPMDEMKAAAAEVGAVAILQKGVTQGRFRALVNESLRARVPCSPFLASASGAR